MIHISDNDELREKKIQREQDNILKNLFEIFPKHRLAIPTHPYRSYYTSWVFQDGQPLREYSVTGDLWSTQFGILCPQTPDNRPRIFSIPIGWLAPAELIADVKIVYDFEKLKINEIIINIFGKKNKGKIRTFATRINRFTDGLLVTVEDEHPRLENSSYLTL